MLERGLKESLSNGERDGGVGSKVSRCVSYSRSAHQVLWGAWEKVLRARRLNSAVGLRLSNRHVARVRIVLTHRLRCGLPIRRGLHIHTLAVSLNVRNSTSNFPLSQSMANIRPGFDVGNGTVSTKP